MGWAVDGDGLVGVAEGFEACFGPAGDAGGLGEDADDGGADGAGVWSGVLFLVDVIGGGAALAVGGSAEGDGGGCAEDGIDAFAGVADGVDGGVAGLLEWVDGDVAAGAEGEAGVFGELVFGADADGEDDESGVEPAAGFEACGDAVFLGGEGFDAIAEDEVDAVVAEFGEEGEGHFRVELWQDLGLEFDEGDGFSEVGELFCHFEADEACADDGDAFGGGGLAEDAVHVLEVSQGEDARVIDAGEGWAEGGGSGGEDEVVVGVVFFGAGGEVAEVDGFVFAVDAGGFGEGADFEVEELAEGVRGLEGEFGAVGDFAADVVGEAAVGEGDVGSAFDDDDAGFFGVAAGAGRGGSATGDAADDEDGFGG